MKLNIKKPSAAAPDVPKEPELVSKTYADGSLSMKEPASKKLGFSLAVHSKELRSFPATTKEVPHVTAINKLTLKPSFPTVPDEEEQPRMNAIKKPSSPDATTPSLVLKPQQGAEDKKKSGNKITLSSTGSTQETRQQTKKPLFANLGKKPSQPKQSTSTSQTSTSDSKPKATGKRDLLWGSGLTKALAGSAAKKSEKTQQSSASETDTTSAAIEGDYQPKALPNQLADDALVLDEYQAAAVDGLMHQMFGCIIGAAGTGKTTALKALVARFETDLQRIDAKDLTTYRDDQENKPTGSMPAIAFCAFMGKAVQQMKRALPPNYHPLASTIHALLGYAPTMVEVVETDENGNEHDVERMRFMPTYTADFKLPYKAIVVDEVGTVPLDLWHNLFAACRSDCRIFFLGDLNQLPPVTGHSILGFAMLHWPTFALEKLHRQAEGDPIAENAHRILAGKKPMTDKETKRFIVKDIADGSTSARKDMLGIIRHLTEQGSFDPMQDSIIVPMNIGSLGQVELNSTLTGYFNPPRKNDEGVVQNPRTVIETGTSTSVFAVGDKVMLTKNDTQLQLTNGMVGVVTKIQPNAGFKGEHLATQAGAELQELDLTDMSDFAELDPLAHQDDVDPSERQASHIMTVELQNVKKPVEFSSAGAFENIVPAYAVTCHKSQGSEYRNVIVLCHASQIKMMTREWLYTAITRAKNRVVLLCNNRGLTHAVNNQRIKGNTIAEKAKKFIGLTQGQNAPDVELPDPQEYKAIKLNMGG